MCTFIYTNHVNIILLTFITHTCIVYDDTEKCDPFNKYFSCISRIDDENVLLPDFESRTGSSISDILCTEEEIVDVIKNLSVNKASGPDLISHKMLKVSPEKIAIPLRIIFNKSLEQRKSPKSWKKAKVIPIFKKGDYSYPSNYRQILRISCVGKVMERIVHKHVYNQSSPKLKADIWIFTKAFNCPSTS